MTAFLAMTGHGTTGKKKRPASHLRYCNTLFPVVKLFPPRYGDKVG
jgi:hypothetical protein